MTAPHPSLGYQRVKPGPRTSRLPGAEIGRLVPPSQPQFTSPHPPRPELGAAKRRRAASRAPPLPASKPGAGAGSRRRQFAKRSLELGSTPTAGGAGDNLAARHVHGHGAAAGHRLGSGRGADLGSRARGLVVAGACRLWVQWRLRVGVGAGAATKEVEGRRQGIRAGWPRGIMRGALQLGGKGEQGSNSPMHCTPPQCLMGNSSLNPQSSPVTWESPL